MDDKEEAKRKLDARFMALEFLMARTYNQVMKLSGIPDEVLFALENRDVQQTGLQTIGIDDPAMSDHIVGVYQDALRRLLDLAREIRAAAQKAEDRP